jgi:hypothetical protein
MASNDIALGNLLLFADVWDWEMKGAFPDPIGKMKEKFRVAS